MTQPLRGTNQVRNLGQDLLEEFGSPPSSTSSLWSRDVPGVTLVVPEKGATTLGFTEKGRGQGEGYERLDRKGYLIPITTNMEPFDYNMETLIYSSLECRITPAELRPDVYEELCSSDPRYLPPSSVCPRTHLPRPRGHSGMEVRRSGHLTYPLSTTKKDTGGYRRVLV